VLAFIPMLQVLCTTSTLAMGVNLPAHLVVIKGTRRWALWQPGVAANLFLVQALIHGGGSMRLLTPHTCIRVWGSTAPFQLSALAVPALSPLPSTSCMPPSHIGYTGMLVSRSWPQGTARDTGNMRAASACRWWGARGGRSLILRAWPSS
jgi:hypothetical protein